MEMGKYSGQGEDGVLRQFRILRAKVRHHHPTLPRLTRQMVDVKAITKRIMCGTLVGTFLLGAAVFAAAFLPPLARAEQANATGTRVTIDNFAFAPQRLTVKSGTTVTWRNEDDIPHTVAATARFFKSSALDTNDTYSFTFTTPGTYEYFCSLHPHMTGTVVVEGTVGTSAAQ
jgi:plastocyanin